MPPIDTPQTVNTAQAPDQLDQLVWWCRDAKANHDKAIERYRTLNDICREAGDTMESARAALDKARTQLREFVEGGAT